MLRQLDSRQLSEMYAYYTIERFPVSAKDEAEQRAQAIQAMFARAAQANEQRAT